MLILAFTNAFIKITGWVFNIGKCTVTYREQNEQLYFLLTNKD